jgi:hypothetical protein
LIAEKLYEVLREAGEEIPLGLPPAQLAAPLGAGGEPTRLTEEER